MVFFVPILPEPKLAKIVHPEKALMPYLPDRGLLSATPTCLLELSDLTPRGVHREYIRNKEKEDERLGQMNFWK